MVRFTFRDMTFNHGISCDVGSGKKSVSENRALKFVKDVLLLISKDSRLALYEWHSH